MDYTILIKNLTRIKKKCFIKFPIEPKEITTANLGINPKNEILVLSGLKLYTKETALKKKNQLTDTRKEIVINYTNGVQHKPSSNFLKINF